MGKWVSTIGIEMEEPLKGNSRIQGIIIKLLISRSKEKIPSKKRKRTPLLPKLIFIQQ
jgi:hypothetical protein